MGRNKDEAPACRVYTVCDESRYLTVRNVPALGCSEELMKLFAQYGEIEGCKPMDAEDCEPYTDVYWIRFSHVSNARFAKRKLDEAVFFGNRIQVSYAPNFESLSDTKEKLERRRKEIMSRISPWQGKELQPQHSFPSVSGAPSQANWLPMTQSKQMNNASAEKSSRKNAICTIDRVSSTMEYFSSPSMNATVNLVRDRLDKIQSSSQQHTSESAMKKPRIDSRRRI